MKKIRGCIRSSSLYGESAYRLLQRDFDFEIVAFMEEINYLKKDELFGIPVLSQYVIAEKYRTGEIDKIIVPGNLRVSTLKNIEKELKSLKIAKEDIIILPNEYLMEEYELSEAQKKQIFDNHEFNYMEYLEFHVADHCNQKCENCTHFSQYVKTSVFPEIKDVENDFKKLKTFVDNIDRIHILGGESLLNPELGEYIKLVKRIYPYTKLSCVTNGILIKKMSSELMATIHEYNVELKLSSYKPLWKGMDDIIGILKSNGIRYRVTPPIDKFFKVIDLNTKIKFPYASLVGVPPCYCKNIYKGKMAVCPTVCYSEYYDEYFHTTQLSEKAKGGKIVLDEVHSFSELRDALEKPCELCDYCLIYRAGNDGNLQEDWKRFEEAL
jgi:organic radical activating enzyme